MRVNTLTDKTLDNLRGHITLGQAVLVLILNLFIPGSGTLLSVYLIKMDVLAIKQKQLKEEQRIKTSFIFHKQQLQRQGRWFALLQLLTFPLFLFGWLWALHFSIKLVIEARNFAM